jgi:cytochrome P450
MTTPTAPFQDAPVLDIDPFARTNLADPHPMHAELRAAGAVVYLRPYNVWAMARYDQVYAALTDPITFCSSRGVGLSDFQNEKPWRPPSLLLEADPPAHTTARAAIGKVLSPGTVRGFREVFRAEANALVDELAARGEFDVITDLAERYPLKVFPDAVGLPVAGRENLLPYGALAFNAFGPDNDLRKQAVTTAAATQVWIWESCQRGALSAGGLGAKLWEAADRGEISHEQAPMLVRSLLSAGVDTTVYGIGNTVLALAANPEQWQKLRTNPALARFAFDEALRYESPVQTFFRTTARQVDVAGVRIPSGQKVLLFLGAANRDPRKWGPDADVYDISRKAAGNVAFGMGIHQCVGQPIARLEVEAVLGAMAERFERLELIGDPKVKLNNTLRGWGSATIRAHRG